LGGAVVYYDALMYESGLLGWGYNLGRVASFFTTVGPNEVADPNFLRLISNTLSLCSSSPASGYTDAMSCAHTERWPSASAQGGRHVDLDALAAAGRK
jgi:hypothetical protein